MNNTVSFTTDNGRFTVSVLTSFVDRYKYHHNDIRDESMYDLVNKYNITKYLHNEVGPAIIDNMNNVVQFWMNGKIVDREVAEKMKFNSEFDIAFDDFLK